MSNYLHYYDYNDKNTVGKHLFFLCVNLNGLKRVSTGFNEGGGGGGETRFNRSERVLTCFNRSERVSTDLNGLKRVSTGLNVFQQV